MLDLRWTVEDDLVLLHRVVPWVDVAFITTCMERYYSLSNNAILTENSYGIVLQDELAIAAP
jgi:hypothetical protein